MTATNWSLTIDHVPGQGWEAHFEGSEPTLGTGGFGWEAPSAELVLAYAADALNEQVRPAGPVSVMDFISSLASNALVHEDFDQGNHVFNHVVRDARRIADQLGVAYSPGENPDEPPEDFA
jgi:hypothetical protein